MAHSRIGPSAAKRWMNCTGSIDLIQFLRSQEKIPLKSPTNKASELGTAVHYVGEQVLLKTRRVNQFKNIPVKVDEMKFPVLLSQKNLDDAQAYVSFCRKAKEQHPGKMVVEETYDLSKVYDAPIGGTTDCSIVGRVLQVIDYKNGAFPVYAEGNPQIMIYGLGAYYKYRKVKKIRKIRLVIFQPNARDKHGPVREHTMHLHELLKWEKEELIPALETIKSGKGVLIPSRENCMFCEAKGFCKALKEQKPKLVKDMIVSSSLIPMLDSGSLPNPEELNEKELISVLQNADHVIEFYTACKKLAKSKLETNKTALPGFGLRPNLGNRSYRSDKILTSTLEEYDVSLRSIKVAASERFMTVPELESYVSTTLEWDKDDVEEFMDKVTTRKVSSHALVPVSEAANDFAEAMKSNPKIRKRRKKVIS
ncbi:MAG: hypothetical protein COB09_18405 [Thalassobium sp.]|nr:MAG: hypothetical protein COB09_18405 [Thalassobium sp.]